VRPLKLIVRRQQAVPSQSPIEPEAPSASFWRLGNRAKFAAILCACAASLYLVVNYEPQSPPVCDYVQILGTVRCGRAWHPCFMVRYIDTGTRRTVGSFAAKPFEVSYIGPAAMITRRGNWTGAYHFEFRYNCPLPSNQRLERP
jgi:hypothetical protein